MNLSWKTKAWHANTKDKEQISLTELIPKINRKNGSIHANMASDMKQVSDLEENHAWQKQIRNSNFASLCNSPQSNTWHEKVTNSNMTYL